MVRSLSIRLRLVLAFVILLVLNALQAGAVAWTAHQAKLAIVELTDVLSVQKRTVADSREANGESARMTMQYLLLLEFPMAADYRKQLDTARSASALAAQVLSTALEQPARQIALAAVQKSRNDFLKLQDRVLQLAQAGKGEEAIGLWARDGGMLLDKSRQAQAASLQAIENEYQATVQHIKDRMGWILWVIGAALAAACSLTLWLAWALIRSITQPLAQALLATAAVARGDLVVAASAGPQGSDELAQLQAALLQATGSLRGTLEHIRASSNTVREASGEMAAGNRDLSDRTLQQSSQLEQTAACVQQLSATVRHNAQTAVEASQLAASASQAAQQGGQRMGEVVERMADIQRASTRIAEIIGVIDGIAFQTNILALNAAVEAARAGEQGRGFAVVAAEVRSLAQRSTAAAREIKLLISDSVEQVGQGSQIVASAGRSVSVLVAQVKQVSALIETISSASREQESGIEQIHHAVEQLDQMTQQTVALVERNAGTSVALSNEADQLAQAVGVFKLRATG